MDALPIDCVILILQTVYNQEKTRGNGAFRLQEIRGVSKGFQTASDAMWKSLFLKQSSRKEPVVRLLPFVEQRSAMQALQSLSLLKNVENMEKNQLEVAIEQLMYRAALLKLEKLQRLAKSGLIIGNAVSGSLRLFNLNDRRDAYIPKKSILPAAMDHVALVSWTQDSKSPPCFSPDGMRLVWLQHRRIFSCFVDGSDLVSVALLECGERVEKMDFSQSEDGTYIVVIEQAQTNSYISICNMEQLQIRQIASIAHPGVRSMVLGRATFSKDARHVAVISSSDKHTLHVFKNPWATPGPGYPRQLTQKDVSMFSLALWHENRLIITSMIGNNDKSVCIKLLDVDTLEEEVYAEIQDTTGTGAMVQRTSLAGFHNGNCLVFLHYTTLRDALLVSRFRVDAAGMVELEGNLPNCWYKASTFYPHEDLRLSVVLGSMFVSSSLSRSNDLFLWDGERSIALHQWSHNQRSELAMMESIVKGSGGSRLLNSQANLFVVIESGRVFVKHLEEHVDSFLQRQDDYGWGPIPDENLPPRVFALVGEGTAASFSPI